MSKKPRMLSVWVSMLLLLGAILLALGMANEKPLNVDDTGIVTMIVGMCGALVGATVSRCFQSSNLD